MEKRTRIYEGIKKISNRDSNPVADELTLEVPLTLLVNNDPLTVTMLTPGDELAFIRGLLFTEGIYKSRDLAPSFEVLDKDDFGFITKVNVSLNNYSESSISKRSLLSVSACGICGKQELVYPKGSIHTDKKFDSSLLPNLFTKMKETQEAFNSSGGCHAASAFSIEGRMLSVMEDIGRHNAVDKVVGDLLNQGALNVAAIILVSGRVSYEIIAKSFAARIPILAAVSAPSSLAVDFAKELGIALLGFCRDNRFTVYSHPERIIV